MHALSQITPRPALLILWDNCPGNVKDSFKTYFKFYANRIGTLQPEYRILPMNEEEPTSISIPGFILQWKGEKRIAEQELGDMLVDSQFIKHHKDRYLELCVNFEQLETAPRTKVELEDFKALLLMDIFILSGCDIEWQPYSDPSSSAAPTSEAVLASANSGDDNSSSDAEAAGAGKAASPVFGVNGVEPAAAPPAQSAALAPSAQPPQGLPSSVQILTQMRMSLFSC